MTMINDIGMGPDTGLVADPIAVALGSRDRAIDMSKISFENMIKDLQGQIADLQTGKKRLTKELVDIDATKALWITELEQLEKDEAELIHILNQLETTLANIDSLSKPNEVAVSDTQMSIIDGKQ